MKQLRALCDAIESGDRLLVKQLLKEVEDINQVDTGSSRTPLTAAIGRDDTLTALLLLKQGADPNLRPEGGWKPESPLQLAALRGNCKLLEALIKHGAQVNSVYKAHNGNAGRTALMNAAASGNLEAVQLLVENNADVAARDERGATALTYADDEGVKKYLAELLQEQPVQAQPGDLAAAAQDGLLDRAKSLLESGIAVDDVNGRGQSALMIAVAQSDIKMVRLLIEHGADVNFRSASGWLPITTYGIQKRMITELLKHGADPNAAMSEGVTALY